MTHRPSGSISPVSDDDRATRLDELRSKLADLGVTLFERPRAVPSVPTADEYAALIADLARSGDPRLAHAIPCLLAVHDGDLAATAVGRAYASLPREDAELLGLRYRLARSLVLSRAPMLALLLGRRPVLRPLPIEPQGVPDPEELLGEKALRFASEAYCERALPDLPGGAERQFDTWIDIAWAERPRRVSA